MRVLAVDDHDLVRRGICAVLAADPTLTICGEAIDGQDAVEKAKQLAPDLVVTDISMPSLNGPEATRQVLKLRPDVQIVIVSQHSSSEVIRQAIQAGAHGYVDKSSISTKLLEAIEKVRIKKTRHPSDPAPVVEAPSEEVPAGFEERYDLRNNSDPTRDSLSREDEKG